MQTLAVTGFLMLVFFLVPCDMGLLAPAVCAQHGAA